MTVTVGAGYSHSVVAPIVQAAIVAYINALPVGGDLPFTELPHIAYSASPGVVNVTAITLNSGTSDLTADQQHVLKSGTVVVS
jgi:hypothetical protein